MCAQAMPIKIQLLVVLYVNVVFIGKEIAIYHILVAVDIHIQVFRLLKELYMKIMMIHIIYIPQLMQWHQILGLYLHCRSVRIMLQVLVKDGGA